TPFHRQVRPGPRRRRPAPIPAAPDIGGSHPPVADLPMTDQKNLIFAIAISIAILLGFQFFVQKPQQEAVRQAQQQAEQAAKPSGDAAPPGAPDAQPAGAPGAAAGAGQLLQRDAALARAPRVPIDSRRLKGSVSLRGGRIDDLTMKDYRETVRPDSPLIDLLSPSDTARPYFVQSGWIPGTDSREVA